MLCGESKINDRKKWAFESAVTGHISLMIYALFFWLIIEGGGLIILNQRSAYSEAVKRKE